MTTARPYSARTGRLPRHLDEVTPSWLTRVLRNRYPGIEVLDMTVVEVRNGHTTKLRVALDLNPIGIAAGIPRQVCMKSNWSEGFESGDICELEARFYHLMRDHVRAPVTRSYFADWDGDGGGRGVVMMEDLAAADGQFGHSTHRLGVDGVARGLESLAVLHGALWGSPLLREQTWLPVSMDTPVDTEQLLRMFNYIALNLAKPDYQAVLPRWIVDTPELFAHAFDEMAAFARTQPRPGRRLGPLPPLAGVRHAGLARQRRPLGPERPADGRALLRRSRGHGHHRTADRRQDTAAPREAGRWRKAAHAGLARSVTLPRSP